MAYMKMKEKSEKKRPFYVILDVIPNECTDIYLGELESLLCYKTFKFP